MKALKSEVVKNVSVLSVGTVVAQIIPLIFAPFIARLYTPDQFGVFAATLALINIFSVIINGRYELAVVLPSKQSRSIQLLQSSWIIGCFVSLILFFVLIPFFGFISNHFHIQFGVDEAIIICVSLVAIGIWQPLNYYFIRTKQFFKMSVNKFVKTTSTAIFTVCLGYWYGGDGINGLVYGLLLGWVFLAVFSVYQGPNFKFSHLLKDFNLKKSLLNQYDSYPKFNALPALVNSIAAQIGVYVFILNFSSETAGYYGFSKQYLYAPLSIVGISLSQVYFQRISEKHHKKETIKKEINLLLTGLTAIALLVVSLVQFFIVDIFEIVFGVEWIPAAQMSRVLIFVFVIQFIVSPLSSLLHALNQVKLASIFPFIYLGSMSILFFLDQKELDPFLNIYLFCEIIPYVVYLLIILYAVNTYERTLINN